MTQFAMLFPIAMMLVPLLSAATAPRRADDVTGTWDVAAKFSIVGGPADGRSHDMKAVLELAQEGKTLTGTFTPFAEDGKTKQPSMPIAGGKVHGGKVTFRVTQNPETSLTFELAVAGRHLRGTATPSKDVGGGGKLTINVDATKRK